MTISLLKVHNTQLLECLGVTDVFTFQGWSVWFPLMVVAAPVLCGPRWNSFRDKIGAKWKTKPKTHSFLVEFEEG